MVLKSLLEVINISLAALSKALNCKSDVSKKIKDELYSNLRIQRLLSIIESKQINILIIIGETKHNLVKTILPLMSIFKESFISNVNFIYKTEEDINRHINSYMLINKIDLAFHLTNKEDDKKFTDSFSPFVRIGDKFYLKLINYYDLIKEKED